MAFKACMILAFTGAAVGMVPNGGFSNPSPVPQPAHQGSYSQPAVPTNYEFEWAVNDAASGNDFGHQESRDGGFTQGNYYVFLPDGRRQKVDYNVQGDSGFVADVTYEGEARPYTPPQNSYGSTQSPRPSYGTPQSHSGRN